jgi:hypothetical protein
MLELWDTQGKALEPVLGGESFEFEYPVPLPQVGNNVHLMTDRWRVLAREFQYLRLESGQNVSKDVLTCSKIE